MGLYNNYLDLKPTAIGTWLQQRRALAEWRLVRTQMAAIRDVLEIGPGHGVFAAVARAHQARYVAVESNRLIAETVAGQDGQVCLSVAPPLPFASACFDVVYASHVIEHMPAPSVAFQFVQEAGRVLRPGGVLALSAPDMLAFGDTFWDADYTHTFPVTVRRLRQLLSDAQLEVVTIARFSGPFSGPAHLPLSVTARLFPLRLFELKPGLHARLERLKLTFLTNLCVVARKPDPGA